MVAATEARTLWVAFDPAWAPDESSAGRGGFFTADPRVRTLLRVLLSYPEVRYILPDRISLDVAAGSGLLETIAHFLERQRWLVRRVSID